jgi:N-methylhydantoinase B
MGGSEETLINHVAGVPLAATDVFHQITGGGAGMGDPLLRAAERVARDVREGYVSAAQARAAYGVVCSDDGVLDEAETERLRESVRAERLGRAPERSVGQSGDEWVPALELAGDSLRCGHCEQELGPASGNWRAGAAERKSDLADRLAEMGIRVKKRSDPAMVLYEWSCPGCATLLETNLYPEDMQPLDDVRVGEAAEVPEGVREI